MTSIDLNPDSPHNPDRTRELADVAAEAVRALNYATRGDDGLIYPGDAYDLLGALGQLAGRLPQLYRQLADWLTEAHNRGNLAEPADGPNQGSTALAVMLTRDALTRAIGDTQSMREALGTAQSTIRAVRYVGPGGEDPEEGRGPEFDPRRDPAQHPGARDRRPARGDDRAAGGR